MKNLCLFLGMTLFGWVGWWLGERVGGIMTAFTLSGMFTMAGVYAGWRVHHDYFE